MLFCRTFFCGAPLGKLKMPTSLCCAPASCLPSYRFFSRRNSPPLVLERRSKVLTIHGTEDETIPVADAHEFAKVIAQHELVVVEGATHRFATEPEQTAVIEALAPYVSQ